MTKKTFDNPVFNLGGEHFKPVPCCHTITEFKPYNPFSIRCNKKKRNRPELVMYKDFVSEFKLRWPRLVEFLKRFEHGGYVISKQEQKARKDTLLEGGIADYGLFVQSKDYTMLWIEFKVKGNTLSTKQKETACMMTLWGAKCVTCWSAEEGIKEIIKYLR